MIDCSKKSFVEFCTRKELQHVPQLEFILYENSFKYYNDVSEEPFNEWITNIFDKEPIECKVRF